VGSCAATDPGSGIRRYAGGMVGLLVVTIWGVNFVMLKAALMEWDPLAFTFVRFLIMLVLSLGVLIWTARGSLGPLAPADVRRLALAGFLGFTLYMLLSVVGIDHTTAFSNALLLAVAPFFTALLL
jgi:drug/metabolite transporter (DMT)-like permease